MLQSLKLLAASSLWLLLLLLCLDNLPTSESLVVPQELPSILSLVYSNIPQIKKGTDSRLGFGFRLGEHADFQVLLELGPQKETQPIGDQDGKSSFNKRQVTKKEQRKALLRQQQLQLKQQQEQQGWTSTERTASSWLQSWSQDMNLKKKPTKSQKQKGTQNDKTDLMPTMPVMPEQALKQLQLLYKMATTSTSTTTKQPPIDGGLNLVAPTGFTLRTETSAKTQPTNALGIIEPKQVRKTKGEITAELMDVSLDDEQ